MLFGILHPLTNTPTQQNTQLQVVDEALFRCLDSNFQVRSMDSSLSFGDAYGLDLTFDSLISG